MSTNEIDGDPITREGLKALQEELETLEGEGRREMAARILAARELGDLSENAEYHIAKEDQGHMETKILRLQDRLRNAVVVDAATVSDTVTFGIPVTVTDGETGKQHTWTFVGPTEAKVAEGKLSSESPMAQALLGAKVGKTVTAHTPRGDRKYTVDSVG